eukprot:1114837-Lingulodinium_polyedra.AAC.1
MPTRFGIARAFSIRLGREKSVTLGPRTGAGASPRAGGGRLASLAVLTPPGGAVGPTVAWCA